MTGHNKIRFGLALLLSTAIAGCTSSSGTGTGGGGTGGGGTGGGGVAEYDAAFDRVSGLAPTSDMPTSISANYKGQMKADVSDSTDIVGQVVADLDLDVNWSDGQTANPFSGGASNFQGKVTGGDFEPISGSLSVDSSLPGTITRQVTPGGTVAGYTVPDLETGAMMVHLTGELTKDAETVDATVQLGGNFFGSGGTAALGAVSGGFSDTGGGSPAIFDGAIGGTYYLEAK